MVHALGWESILLGCAEAAIAAFLSVRFLLGYWTATASPRSPIITWGSRPCSSFSRLP